MKKLLLTITISGLFISCNTDTFKPTQDSTKTLVVTVKDYSLSYLTANYDSIAIRALFYKVAQTGGDIVLVRVDENSTKQSVYLTQVDKLDTVSTANIKNIYEASRTKKKNELLYALFSEKLDKQIADYLTEVNKYAEAHFTDLQRGLELSATTVCETTYQQGYNRYILCLSDMINDPPYERCKPLLPIAVCNASVLLVRPSACISKDSLQTLFPGSDIHLFTTVHNAISFINQ